MNAATRPPYPANATTPFDLIRQWRAAGRLELTAGELAVLLDIAERSESTGQAWPSARGIAAWTGYHLRFVRRAFDRIEATGIATRNPRPGGPAVWSFMAHESVAIHVAWLSTGARPSARTGNPQPEVECAPMGPGVRADGTGGARPSARRTYRTQLNPCAHPLRVRSTFGDCGACGEYIEGIEATG